MTTRDKSSSSSSSSDNSETLVRGRAAAAPQPHLGMEEMYEKNEEEATRVGPLDVGSEGRDLPRHRAARPRTDHAPTQEKIRWELNL